MESVEQSVMWPWPAVLAALAISQIMLWAAREPLQAALRAGSASLHRTFRLAARWCRRVAEVAARRNREVLLEVGRAEMESRLQRELTRVEAGYARHLRKLPELSGRIEQAVTRLEDDMATSAEVPPEVPGWPDAVSAVAGASEGGREATGKLLEQLRDIAVESEKKALRSYREGVSKRHRVLAAMASQLKSLRALSQAATQCAEGALRLGVRVDAQMERYEALRRGDDAAERSLAASAVSALVVSSLVMGIALGATFVNFQLIALPMSELVPAGTRLAGVPVATIAAMVLVLMEAAAGIFLMEGLGITKLFPSFDRLSPGQTRLIIVVASVGLFTLASVEASLALLREQIVEADLALKQALGGGGAPLPASAVSMWIPVLGQSVLGFVLPWILAMIAVPLEMFVHSARVVGGRVVVAAMHIVAVVLRIFGVSAPSLAGAACAVLDVYIAVPLRLERALRGRWIRGPRDTAHGVEDAPRSEPPDVMETPDEVPPVASPRPRPRSRTRERVAALPQT